MGLRVSLAFFFPVLSKGKAKKTKEIRTSARPSLHKMWRVDRTFLFLGGLKIEQVLGRAYRKCGGSTALFFLGSEHLFSLSHSFPLSFPLFPSFSIFLPLFYLFYLFSLFFHFCYFFFYLFTSFSSFFSFFLPFFTSFFLSSPFSHYFPFFSFFPFFFAFFFAFSLAWPRPQPYRLTLPSLTLPHITSPLLSFLTTFFFNKKKGASRFSADICAE